MKKNPTIQAITTKTNSRIQALLNEIVNDGEAPTQSQWQNQTTYTPLVPVKPPLEKSFTPRIASVQELRPITIDEVLAKKQPMKVLPSPPLEIIADIFPSKGPNAPQQKKIKLTSDHHYRCFHILLMI